MTDWPIKTLGDLITVQNGYAFDSEFFSLNGKIGLIRIRDLKSGTDTETCYEGPYDADYVVSAGDYLIGMDGEFRCYEWQGEPALLNQRVCRLRGFDKSLESRFLFYGINKFLKDIEDVTGYTTVKHLSSKSILAIEMPVPPLEEQKRIVKLLDAATAHVTELNELDSRRSILGTQIREAFIDKLLEPDDSWTCRPMAEWCSEIGTGPFGSLVHKADYVEIGIPLVNPMNIKDGRIVEEGIKRVSADKALDLNRYILHTGDIVLGRRGEMGRCAVVRSKHEGWICGTGSFFLRLNPECNADFLALWLSSRQGRAALCSISSGTTMDNLGNQDLGSLQLAFPNRATQDCLVSRASVFDDLVADVQVQQTQRRELVAKLRQSILHAAFVGDL